MQPWMLDRAKSLGEVLVAQGALSQRRCELLANLVREHIEQHGGDVESSIVAASAKLPAATKNAIASLPDEQRSVFLMHEVEGVPFEEISKRTGIPQNTLLSRKRYAVLKLREMLSRHVAGESEE